MRVAAWTPVIDPQPSLPIFIVNDRFGPPIGHSHRRLCRTVLRSHEYL